MARYVAASAEGDTVGVVAEANTIGATMAEAFVRELERQGGAVSFTELLTGGTDWFRLPTLLGDSLAAVDALYLPVTGAQAPEHAAGALRGLDLVTFPDGRPQVFGNTEWGQLETSRDRASQYNTAFTSDFYVDEDSPLVAAFADRYRELAGVTPDRLAYTGYDVSRLILAQLARRPPEQSMAEALRTARPFDGLGHRVYFAGGSVNEAMFILGWRDGRLAVYE
jgi:ABC-type branched-subunit amino acid transport system substrate-binding protein